MTIAENRKARHEYSIEERYEAGMVLHGWEVKAIRANRAQLKESYVIIKRQELWILGMHVSPLISASTHVQADPLRTRKLLLHRREIEKLSSLVERAGYTLIPLNLHFQRGRIKVEIGLAKGKKLHDKRESAKEKDWQRQKARLLKQNFRS